ncbi:hypothetical protein DL96DRAFT_1011915 [Flagelloscypha sp. PMI_526]|nr:hypothetical protein DL96DRAFT_1011915 [Flagelloscypha sp. PMI_526]
MDSTLGALEIGDVFNVFLAGMVTIQAYYYYSRFPDDSKFLKWIVLAVWVSELAQTSTHLHVLYTLTVSHYGHPIAIVEPPKSLLSTVAIGGFSVALVQGFLAFRVYRFIKILPLALLCWILTVLRFVGCLAITANGIPMTSLEDITVKWGWLLIVVHMIGLANDVLVTGGLCFSLVRSKRQARTKMKGAIDKLIVWSLETGLITVLCSLLVVILFFTKRHNYVWIAIYSLSAKLYSNSLLAILNGRMSLRADMGSEIQVAHSTLSRVVPIFQSTEPSTLDSSTGNSVLQTRSNQPDCEMGSIKKEEMSGICLQCQRHGPLV